jgi:hypothetical protein
MDSRFDAILKSLIETRRKLVYFQPLLYFIKRKKLFEC